MGKKGKIGKARKDKFYRLAKETGYRARSAFKLLQLNRKYEFLQQSRVCIDLCAAPGGWLQVAQQHMPVSSVIVGVDLMPIKPIPNVQTFQEDITSDKCRQTIRKCLQTWHADVVLNDGAPNVGKNWIHDAFSQAQLTLMALKLATDFLRKGGWFVTKVFRSKDYHALMWVFQQLFWKVHATKPQASRNESAEIFVVCEGYLKPDKIDPKFLDTKYVFKDVMAEPAQRLNLIHPEKQKRKAEGYAEGDYTLYHKVNVSDFVSADNHLELLADANELSLDDERLANHPATTAEIRECCRDIRVLGKKDIRNLLTWRLKMKKHLESLEPKVEKKSAELEEIESDDEETKLENQLAELEEEQKKALKRKRKKVMREKRNLRDKMSLNMVIPGDHLDITDDINLFDLKKIKNKKQLSQMDVEPAEESEEYMSESDDELQRKGRHMVSYDRFGDQVDETISDDEPLEWEEEEEDNKDEESADESAAEEEPTEHENPLVVGLETRDLKIQRKTNMWFNKDIFSGVEEENDEDLEIHRMTQEYKKKGGVVIDKGDQKRKKVEKKADKMETEVEDEDMAVPSEESEEDVREEKDDSSSDSDSDSDEDDDDDAKLDDLQGKQQTSKGKATKAGFEIVPAGAAMKKRKLDAVSLAIGAEMIKSSKRRRDILDQSYNRYTHGEEDLPAWFTMEEAKHCKKQLPVTKDQVEEYKDRMRAIDARPIKKVAEAKARKKRKSLKKLEKARKRAEVVSDAVDVSDREKWQQIRQIYKRAGLLKSKNRELTYVVAKKGVGKRVRRPAGVQGTFRVVDPRMKKDQMKKKAEQKKRKGKGKPKSQKNKR